MDNDGDMDIVSASYNDDTIAWYENNGAADPSWSAADIATGADGAHSVFVAEIVQLQAHSRGELFAKQVLFAAH